MTTVIICPGFHEVSLTHKFQHFLINSSFFDKDCLVFPTDRYLPFSGLQLYQFLQQNFQHSPDKSLIFLGFSAGVVAASEASRKWQENGGKVAALIAFDGWGVPLGGNFPIYRISHDSFTHYSSLLLGGGKINFYAEPGVDHLDLWRIPEEVRGWMTESIALGQERRTKLSLSDFLASLV